MDVETVQPTRNLQSWRSYHNQQNQPPRRLSPSEYENLDRNRREQYDEERLAYHGKTITIETPLISHLTQEARLLLIANRHQVGARQGIIVSGRPTTGKTTALLALGKKMETRARHRRPDHDDAPVVFVSLPPQTTPKSIARSIVSFLGINPPSRTTFQELSDAAVGLLTDQRTQFLIIDEIHNIFIQSKAGAEASDFLKYLAERISTTMVYAGVEVRSAGLFDGVRGRQLAGRFTLVPARPFSLATASGQQAWKALVRRFESNLRLIHHDDTLTLPHRYLFTRTGGHIGSLANLIRKGAITAILNGQERIDHSLLQTIQIDVAAQRAEASQS